MADRYRAEFEIIMPISETDYDVLVMHCAGNYSTVDGYERFRELTRPYRAFKFRTKALDLDTATMLKLRFGGTITLL